jgi:serpin B
MQRQLPPFLGMMIVATAANCHAQGDEVTTPSEDVARVVSDNTAFALDLYAQLRQAGKGNLFYSPYSISVALAMTYAGARGETEAQMADVLHFALPQNQLHHAIGNLRNTLDEGVKSGGYELIIANRLWGRKEYEFMDSFLATTRDDYGAELVQLAFGNKAEESRQTINAWVEDATKDRIQELLKPGIIDRYTVLVLTNAIYFKGTWEQQFDSKYTKDAPFRLTDGTSVDVPMMQRTHRWRCYDSEKLQILELPYQGRGLSMLILLPRQDDGLEDLEKDLTPANLQAWRNDLREQRITVWLPRFTMTSEFKLNDTLAAMGMPLAFSEQSADFSGMNGGREQLFVSAVVHKDFVDVNEEGTEAAAATAVVIAAESAPPSFRADHPFIFLVMDNHTGSVLFIGRVADPSG